MVTVLLKNGAKSDSTVKTFDDDHVTPLALAAMTGYFNIAQELLLYKANPNYEMDFNLTPFCYAYREKNIRMIKLFLEHNADPQQLCGNDGMIKNFFKPRTGKMLIKELGMPIFCNICNDGDVKMAELFLATEQ